MVWFIFSCLVRLLMVSLSEFLICVVVIQDRWVRLLLLILLLICCWMSCVIWWIVVLIRVRLEEIMGIFFLLYEK